MPETYKSIADRVCHPENRSYRIESTGIFMDAILRRIPTLALRYTRSFKLTECNRHGIWQLRWRARRSIDSAPIRSACHPRAPRSATSPVGTCASSAGNRPRTDSRQTGYSRFSHHSTPTRARNACDISCRTLSYKAIKAHRPTGISNAVLVESFAVNEDPASHYYREWVTFRTHLPSIHDGPAP